MNKNFSKQLLELLISDLDFVNNEEFEVQKKVLKKTREKLELIEKKIEKLELSLSK